MMEYISMRDIVDRDATIDDDGKYELSVATAAPVTAKELQVADHVEDMIEGVIDEGTDLLPEWQTSRLADGLDEESENIRTAVEDAVNRVAARFGLRIIKYVRKATFKISNDRSKIEEITQ